MITLTSIRAVLRQSVAIAPDGRAAAVATILRESSQGVEALLIRRAEHDRDPWSGHMAFPGGRHDAGDKDLAHTAVRETREEIGLDLSDQATLLGHLPPVPAMSRGLFSGFHVTPFVFELRGDPVLQLNHEVAEVLWAPLSSLARGEAAATYPYRKLGVTIPMPAFNVQDRLVWGLTYRMLQSLFEVVRGEGRR